MDKQFQSDTNLCCQIYYYKYSKYAQNPTLCSCVKLNKEFDFSNYWIKYKIFDV